MYFLCVLQKENVSKPLIYYTTPMPHEISRVTLKFSVGERRA